MSDESPETHPLEAGLRAQAAKRRAELGAVEPSMPGPMRAQLQAQVARQQAQEARVRTARPGFLAWFFQWQRALATVGVTLLVIGLFAWNDGWFARRDSNVAKQAEKTEQQAAAPNSVANREADGLSKRADAPSSALDGKEQAKPAPILSPPADAVAGGKLAGAPKVAQTEAPSEATAPAAAAPPASEPRSETFATKSAAGTTQNFVQSQAQVAERARRAAPQGAKDERAAPLLNEFEFRQNGNRIEIVDADGSVYAGEIDSRLKKDKGLADLARDKAASPAPAGAAKPSTSKAKNAEIAAQFNFRASGMNNTLRQQVTIEGVYQGPAPADVQNAPGTAATGGAMNEETLKANQRQLQLQAPSRARVVGRAQVNGRDVQVDAEATK